MNSKKPLYLIVATFVLPILLAAFYFWWIDPEDLKTNNFGKLLAPPLQKSTWVDSLPSTSHRWQLVLVHAPACESACEKELARLASIQQALQKNIPRVEVALWSHENMPPQISGVKLEHLKIEMESKFVMVDPIGNIILSYALTDDTSGILRDLKRLLKVSQIG